MYRNQMEDVGPSDTARVLVHAVTQHTTACCSVQVIDITLTKTPFHEYYTQ
jgi:hypothetical protein